LRNRKGLATHRRKSFRCKVPETGLEPAPPVKATRPSTCCFFVRARRIQIEFTLQGTLSLADASKQPCNGIVGALGSNWQWCSQNVPKNHLISLNCHRPWPTS